MDEPTREFDFEEMASKSARCATLAAIHLVSGDKPGRLLVLDADRLTLGRAADCDLQFPVDGVSRKHARLERTSQSVFTIYDTNSTNGLFVNGFATHEQRLKDGDRVALGPNLVFSFRSLQEDEAQAMETLSASRSRDAVTGALNADYLEEMLRFELELGQRRNFEVGLVCIDLPNLTGGQVDLWARRVYKCLEDKQKPGSLIGRLGPGRFVQSLAFVSRQEFDSAAERIVEAIHQAYPELTFLTGSASSRDLASPSAAGLLEKASKLTKVT